MNDFTYINLWGRYFGVNGPYIEFLPDRHKKRKKIRLSDVPEKLRPVQADILQVMPLPVRPSVYFQHFRGWA